MIEFKGECGHTIRAKDEDAGKVVRCSYCSAEAKVPHRTDGRLDSLLNEVERTGEYDPVKKPWFAPKPSVPKTPPASVRTGPRTGSSLFSVVLKMCYAAIIIVVLVIVGRASYRYWIVGERVGRTAETEQKDMDLPISPPAPQEQIVPESPARVSSARGLLRPKLRPNQNGVFFQSVPPGATVYVRSARDVSNASILKDVRTRTKVTAGTPINLAAGRYQVAVAMRITNRELMRLPGYPEARRKLEDPSTGKDRRVEALEDYFLPDRATRIVVETLSDFSQVIVRHYEVEVVQKHWTPETALFLPRNLTLSELVACLPTEKAFGYDADEVRTELAFREVPPEDQPLIIEALLRIGMIPYRVSQEGRRNKAPAYRLFSISAIDGAVSSPLLQ